MTKLLIATHNKGKKAEYAELFSDLAGLDLELMTLDDLAITDDVKETGDTFEANALLKARGYVALSGLPTLADDSGLVVDALNGEPGVYSARYGGPGLDDEGRYRLLLNNLADVPDAERTARFRCVIAIVMPDGRERTASGACEGVIAREPVGEHGFGYDPVFYLPELERTMAQLPADEKNALSHRAHAAVAARPLLAELLA